MLRPNLADHPVADFQHWPPWRPLVVTTAIELVRFTGQHLITPQTIVARAYLDEIFAGLRDAGQAVFHVVLDTDEHMLRQRIQGSPPGTGLAPGSPGRVPGIALVDDPGSRPRRGHGMLIPLKRLARSLTPCPDFDDLQARSHHHLQVKQKWMKPRYQIRRAGRIPARRAMVGQDAVA